MTSEADRVDEAAADDSGVVEAAGLLTGLDSIGVLVLAAAVLSGVLDGVVSIPWLEDEAGVYAGVVWAAEDSGVVTAADDAGVVAWEVYLVLVDDW
jgi:hypothetical protein